MKGELEWGQRQMHRSYFDVGIDACSLMCQVKASQSSSNLGAVCALWAKTTPMLLRPMHRQPQILLHSMHTQVALLQELLASAPEVMSATSGQVEASTIDK